MHTVPSVPKPFVEVGSIFHDRYQVSRCIKAGGMGAVYDVTHLETQRRCALKIMLPVLVQQPALRSRFRQEACVTAQVQSEHLVQVHDAGVDDASGLPFLVMELLVGDDLRTLLTERNHLPAEEVVELLRQLARALDRTHAAGIVHRDLKPANLFVTRRDDGSPWLKVLDFGIAKIIASHGDPHTTQASGTPLYMPPEQILGKGDIGPAADIYAVGMLTYKLLVGEAYWAPEHAEAKAAYRFMQQVLRGPTVSPVKRAATHGVVLPASFARWFAVSTAYDPKRRYSRATEQVEELAEVLLESEHNTSPLALPGVHYRATDPTPLPSPPMQGAPTPASNLSVASEVDSTRISADAASHAPASAMGELAEPSQSPVARRPSSRLLVLLSAAVGSLLGALIVVTAIGEAPDAVEARKAQRPLILHPLPALPEQPTRAMPALEANDGAAPKTQASSRRVTQSVATAPKTAAAKPRPRRRAPSIAAPALSSRVPRNTATATTQPPDRSAPPAPATPVEDDDPSAMR